MHFFFCLITGVDGDRKPVSSIWSRKYKLDQRPFLQYNSNVDLDELQRYAIARRFAVVPITDTVRAEFEFKPIKFIADPFLDTVLLYQCQITMKNTSIQVVATICRIFFIAFFCAAY